MAIMDPRKAMELADIREFGGIRSRVRISAEGAADMRNFRILPDGSLEKRGGFRKWLSLSAPIRGVWEGTVNGKTYFFAVAGSTVWCVKPGESAAVSVYELTTSEGDVSFSFYREQLYLIDGASLLRFLPSMETFSIAEGYTPLYGRNWHPTEMGSVLEGLNMIQNRIRIHYLNTTGSTSFRLPYTMKKLDHVKVGSTYITNYSFTPHTNTFRIPNAEVGGTVEVGATLDDIFSRRSTVLRSKYTAVYEDPYHETFFCYGGAPGYLVYRSAAVTNEMLAGSNTMYGSSDPLYIPENSAFTVGSIQHPVTAACQCGEQMLVLNDQSLWSLRHTDDSTDEIQIYLLNAGIGCSAPKGTVLCGSSPVAVQENGITRLDFQVSDPDICTAVTLSDEISDRTDHRFLHSATMLWHRRENELWVRDPEDPDGLVWIYDLDRDRWFCFDGIRACFFFERAGCVGFGTTSGDICLMDDTTTTDDGAELEAYYLSHYLCFSRPEFQKRSVRALLCADTYGSGLTLTLDSDRNSQSFALAGTDGCAPELFDRRLAMGRFRFLRYRVSANGGSRCRIHFLKLAANN